MNNLNNLFTVEESNLICIYLTKTNRRLGLIKNIHLALPYMDVEMKQLALKTINKLNKLTDSDFDLLSFVFTD